MNRYLLPVLLFGLFFWGCKTGKQSSEKTDLVSMHYDTYEQIWAKVDSLEQKGLYQSAREIVEDLAVKAKTDKNAPQIVKTTLYRCKYLRRLEEEGELKSLSLLQTEIDQAPFPAQAFLQSVLAEAYSHYLRSNRWKLQNRTEMEEKGEDPASWPPGEFERRSNELYLQSVQDERTKQVAMDLFEAVTLPGKFDFGLRPTLYDFLAHRALDHFANEQSYLHAPAYAFYIESEQAFAPVEDFIRWEINTRDSTSYKYLALRLFQDLLSFRLEQQEAILGPEALLDADLKRLRFVYDNGVQADKSGLYVRALEQRRTAFGESPLLTDVLYALAQWQYEQGGKYKPGMPDETYKAYWKEALNTCESCLKLPQHESKLDQPGRAQCALLKASLLKKKLSAEAEQVYLPDEPSLVKINFRNLTRAFLKILPYDESVQKKMREAGRKGALAQLNYLNSLDPIWAADLNLPPQDDLHRHSLETALPPQKTGQYLLMLSSDSRFRQDHETGYLVLTYSTLGFWQRNLPDGTSDFFVFDRQSGHPLENVRAEAWVSKYLSVQRAYRDEKVAETQSDKDGHFQFNLPEKQRNFRLKLIRGEDELFLNGFFYSYFYGSEPRAYQRTFFFLDRAIYRPGQTVYFKALLLEFDKKEKPRILANTAVTILLRDANYQEVAKLKLKSNNYGTVSGTFTAPSSGLTGNMFLESSIGGNRMNFRVEEYKRPKFFVKTEPVKNSFRLNETVELPGKAEAYAGYPLDGATVIYRVVREVSFPWMPWWYWRWGNPWAGQSTEIARGQLTTDASGSFVVPFTALPDKSIPQDKKPEFSYTVFIDVTDITGETHSTQTVVRAGTVALKLEIELPEQMESKELRKLPIKTYNLQGMPAQADLELSLEQLKVPDRLFVQRYWDKPDIWSLSEEDFLQQFPHYAYRDQDEPSSWPVQDVVLQKKLRSDGGVEVMLGKKLLPAGVYRLLVKTRDEFGTPVETERYIYLFNTDKGLMPHASVAWHFSPEGSYEPGEEAVWHLGTALEDLPVLLEVERDGRIIRREWTKVRGLTEFRQKIKEEDRGNLQYMLHYAALNRQNHVEETIVVPWSNKQLKVEYRSFRDKLLPGEEERWEIVLSGPQGEKVAAEMLATMYDASLDAFVAKPWGLNVWPVHSYVQNSLSAKSYSEQNSNPLSSSLSPQLKSYSRVYRRLNDFGMWAYGGGYVLKSMAMETKARKADALEEEQIPLHMAAPKSAAPPLPPESKEVEEEEQQNLQTEDETAKPIAPRENLKETVFFFPDLHTDAEGRIILSFTMNEALTRWKFQLFAHTPDLKYVLDTREVLTQKDLMVVPHPPRFLREGDEIEFTAKIVNLSEHALGGNAVLQMVNPLNSVPVYKWLDNPQFNRHFEVQAGQSTLVAWRFKVPSVEEVPLIEYTVEAAAGDYTDAERNLLPVLTDRMLVTETMPLPVRGKERKTFVFKRMQNQKSETLAHYGLTLEFTSNPAWYAVQALPYLMEYPYECSEQIFARYYANSLATSVANSQPRIKEIFEAWSEEDLQSPLSKNQELKSALLEETPWVLDAQSEEEQRKNIALLFDLHRMAKERAAAMDKLAQRQLANGGFAWFDGGRANWYITQYIVEGLAHLDRLGALQANDKARLQRMLKRAVSYLDDELLDEYNNLAKAVKKGHAKWEDDHLHPLIVHYLYTRSFFLDRSAQAGLGLVGGDEGYLALSGQLQKVFDYYLGQAEKYWLQKSIYEEGLLAIALHRTKREETAKDILRSLKERALISEEMGMYWKTSRGYYWYQHPIERQALLIEAFNEVVNDEESVEAMKTWLLKHKQTNAWHTTKATAEAVYALLSFGENWLAESEPVHITMGREKGAPWNQRIAEAQKEAMPGTGYFKLHFSAEEMSDEMAVVEVENPNEHVSWGALYWQYFETLGNITTFEDTPLKLKRELYKVVLTDRGEQLVGLSANETLSPGDKVRVRIELRVDRDMEYVHMRDMRASGFEPMNVLSRYKWQGGLGYYESTRDASTDFFFSYLPKGTYVFEYTLRVAHRGKFSNGITSIQCMYAPEFSSHAEGLQLSVE